MNQSTMQRPVISTELLQQYDVPGPRYTSYPTADRFVEAFNETTYIETLKLRKASRSGLPISLYVHIPFCESLCFFCACNKIVTKNHERSAAYLHYLFKEIDLHLPYLGKKPQVSQLHLGGGSPTFFTDNELTQLMRKLRESFTLSPAGEFSIEVDPRTVDADRLDYLRALGFNRISFGVQDFNPEVQEAVHREQAPEQVFGLVEKAREFKYESINVDLIYGLPKQTGQTFSDTVDQIIDLGPDRIALYAYAHLPEKFKPQRRIDQHALPTAVDKISMLSMAVSKLLAAGYVYIGMDHFALPRDELAVAKRQGRLHRNFQGYSTQSDTDLIGLGVSSIGKVGATYSQNAKDLNDYYDSLDQGRFPIARGLGLSKDDLIRRTVIMALMCQGEVDFEAIDLACMIDFKQYFAQELEALKPLAEAGMLVIDETGLLVSDKGWFFVRAIAMTFDQYLQADTNRTRFSKIL